MPKNDAVVGFKTMSLGVQNERNWNIRRVSEKFSFVGVLYKIVTTRLIKTWLIFFFKKKKNNNPQWNELSQ